ncbi:MAG: hypothetical protein ACR2NL_07505, partial [Acidimicrobiia bacterium]
VRTQAVTVEVARLPEKPDLRAAGLRDAILAELEKAPLSEKVRFDADELHIVEHQAGTVFTNLEHGYGGAMMRLSNDDFECTSGFVVRRSSDWLEGVLTASHCEGLTQMDENNTEGGTNLTFSAPWKGEHIGAYGDVEWHSTTHDDFPQFWATDYVRHTQRGRVYNFQIGLNDDVCRYGRSTGLDCGVVDNVNVSHTFTWLGQTVTAQNLARTANMTSTGGDSGGPYFVGGTAWGIHHGSFPITGSRYFSKIQNAELAFGVFVQTE